MTFIHEKLGKIQHKFSGPEVSHPNTCTSESMTYWLARGKQWFLLYLAGHWLEHALISPLIYIHLDNLGVLGRLKQRRTHKRDLCALNVISTYFYCVRSQIARIKGRSHLKNRLPAYGSRKMCNKCIFFKHFSCCKQSLRKLSSCTVYNIPKDIAQKPLQSNLQLWFHFPLAIQSHDNTQGGEGAAVAFPLPRPSHQSVV